MGRPPVGELGLFRDLTAVCYGRVARSELDGDDVRVESAWAVALEQFDAVIKARQAIIETAANLPTVRAHHATLGQILANLLGNALKFVPAGKAPLVVFRWEDLGSTVRLWVEDNGIGIAAHHQERIFRVFERLHRKEYGGTRIGLAIVRKGVERMGETVGVISTEGEGVRFWLELPRA